MGALHPKTNPLTGAAPRCALLLALALFAAPLSAAPNPPIAVGPDRRVQVYKLESVILQGSTRLTAEQVAVELGLVPGTPLDDTLVMNARSRLLGLGLFKSAILIMRKGTQPGFARLIIEVEDDGGVLTDWALGGELGVTGVESSVPAADPNAAPMDYRLGLIGRNLFGSLHRGTASLDLDSSGTLRQGQIAYGLPRFAKEDAQFDCELAVVDPYYRYLDAMGFGARGEGLWALSVTGLGEMQYGAAMYVNKGAKFNVRGFPTAVAGPKVAFFRESRLRSFFPGSGSMLGASLLLAPTESEKSVVEVAAARTLAAFDVAYFTVEGRGLAVGTGDYSLRAEGRVDIPFGHAEPGADQAEAFLRLRGGVDRAEDTSLEGSAAILGLRYHSSGFIAELAVKVTRSPEELAPKKINTRTGGLE